MALNGPKTWTLRKVIRNTLKVFKCGGREGGRRSDGLIMWKMTGYYKEITRKGTFYIQQKEGRLTGLDASCVATAG